ncbi:FxsA family protein [Mycolicibacterium sp.]|uniref:FxsA family protein n=1 Tax=Mycolicibacterium sp. TaxID=2320850 RepID=UPI0028ADDFB1|nr:FxsA family protein [Mycolicibacterium sp.]
MRPLLRYAALYALVELAAVALLIWAVGLGWTLVVLAAVFLAGVLLAASQLRNQVVGSRLLLRQARRNPHGAAADGVLIGIGSLLVLVPGVVSTAVGALMLTPATRSSMRPLAASMVSRGVVRGARAVNLDQFLGSAPRVRRGDYIDGEVVSDPAGPRPEHTAIARRGAA